MLRRTELKRKTPMKRTGIKRPAIDLNRKCAKVGESKRPRRALRRVSKTNSRPWEDKEFREEYRAANPDDEILNLFPRVNAIFHRFEWNGMRVSVPHGQAGAEIHHIFGFPRYDRIWGIINTSFWTHKFCERYDSDGVTLCITAKVEKGEWDREAAMKCLGYDPIGWLSTKRPVFEFVVPLWAALVKGVE